ncbi:O-acetyl-ADP-ribose deacetylase [Virgibacillus sp. 179-BFC.A HS]|uniref:O-acetyl-ADP-ribose deacetylase n=1 Tax=Tigheibacillus jepli TaxID=3035914 RepID=A0ABU5CCZ0_9BACI|nr:O-acetyl-ADP-ribose deacetylase [Virgibacillus sp. 179-BFC.A HS]MDY0404188.1 O-acetyl-ADP-ribose deacetylase [Virgibacillus sp. 179-BFC.A HS]
MEVIINNNTLALVLGDITKQTTEAIVNAANGTLMGGGGVDGAIHRAAGKKLLEACKQVRQNQLNGEHLPTGEAVITKGYELPAKFVIHTVGPVWSGDKKGKDALLANCYKNSLRLAVDHHLTSISFPSISTGVYHFPIDKAAEIAMKTIVAFLQEKSFGKVVMTLFSEKDYETYAAKLRDILA